MKSKHSNMSKAELRKFGLVTGAMLILFFDLLIPWIWEITPPTWPLVAAGILAALAMVVPAALGPVYKAWMAFAEVLGWINTRILLSVIFFLLFLPMGLLLRLIRDPMRRKLDSALDTYRIQSNPPKPENMERPF